MKTKRLLIIVPLLLLIPAVTARAIPIDYIANLNGPSEDPPNASPGTGFADVTFDFAAHTMRVQITFSGLVGLTTASHIHSPTAVPFSGIAGVATQVPTFSGFPLGVMAGTYDMTFDTSLASTYNPAFVTANGSVAAAEAALAASLAAGTSYVNIHTTEFPGGEIRGFLVAVPETFSTAWATVPFTVLLLAAGVRKSRAQMLRP